MKFLVYVKIIIELTTSADEELMKVDIFLFSFFSDLSLKTGHNEKKPAALIDELYDN